MRVGRRNDGGYLVPRSAVLASDHLISCGVSDDWSFEADFRRQTKAPIDAYDYSVSQSLFFLRILKGAVKLLIGKATIADLSKRYTTWKAYPSFFAGDVRHHRNRICGSPQSRRDVTLDDTFARTKSNHVFLKIDIEGDEYGVIDSISRLSDRITGLVIEFHQTDSRRPEFEAAIDKLQAHFALAHVHANNSAGVGGDDLPEVLELTFVPRASVATGQRRLTLPLPELDNPCDPERPDFTLSFADPTE